MENVTFFFCFSKGTWDEATQKLHKTRFESSAEGNDEDENARSITSLSFAESDKELTRHTHEEIIADILISDLNEQSFISDAIKSCLLHMLQYW